MTHPITVSQPRHARRLLLAVLLMTLAVGGYLYYSVAHHSVDLFTMPNPTANLHPQQPITGDTPKSLDRQ